jgi:hypothetical protein
MFLGNEVNLFPMKTVEEVYSIHYDAQLQAVRMVWNGYATSEQFRAGTELMLETLAANKAHKVLADLRAMELIGTNDQHWLENNFVPRAIEKGFRELAIVQPEAYFTKVSVESVSYKVENDKLTISFFKTPEAAEQFLSEHA